MKNKMLMLADWHCASSGFGTVTKGLLPEFRKAFKEIIFVAINYYGEEYKDGNITVVPAKTYFVPLNKPENQDPFGKHSFLYILSQDNQIDFVFIMQDVSIGIELISVMRTLRLHRLNNNKKSFKSCFYFPIDGSIEKSLFNEIDFFDLLVTYNQYSKNEVLKHRPELFKKIKVIPHGTNTTDFFPMDKEEVLEFRNGYFGNNSDKVIITTINRNQPRKAIGDTILAFIEAKNMWQSAAYNGGNKLFLYLHMMDSDFHMCGYDLRKIFSQTDLVENVDYKIADQYFFTQLNGADISILRGIYNASDVFVTNTTGEGYGLTVIESMACRLPVVAPNHTSLVEIGGNGKRMYAMEELEPFINQFDSLIRLRANIEETAEKIVLAVKSKFSGQDKQMVELTQEKPEGGKQ